MDFFFLGLRGIEEISALYLRMACPSGGHMVSDIATYTVIVGN